MLKKAILEAKMLARLMVAFLFYLFPVLLFVRLAAEVPEQSPPWLDIQILEWLHRFSNPALTKLAIAVTSCGGPYVIVGLTLIIALMLYLWRHHRASVVLLTGVGGAALINIALKLSFQRVRPHLWVPVVYESSSSFPSGHAMISSALAFSVMYIFWHTRWRWWAIMLGLTYTLIIGLTRLYLGVHFPTDVIAGWAVGFTWVVIVRTILRQSHRWRQGGLMETAK